MSLPNGLNYFEYLLLKSLCVKQYKLVTRDFLEREIWNTKWCDCKYCAKTRAIKRELRKRGFKTTNIDCEWWRISEGWGKITVARERDECWGSARKS